jgi:hypothetical protein
MARCVSAMVVSLTSNLAAARAGAHTHTVADTVAAHAISTALRLHGG